MTDEEVVKRKYPDAYPRGEIYEDSVRTLRLFTVYRPQPGHEKDCCQRLSSGWSLSETDAWADAAKRIQEPGA